MIHKSIYKTITKGADQDGNLILETVKAGRLCGQTGVYSSSDWIAVTCPKCIESAPKPGEEND